MFDPLSASQPNQNARLSVVSVDSATYDDPPKVETAETGDGTGSTTTEAAPNTTTAHGKLIFSAELQTYLHWKKI